MPATLNSDVKGHRTVDLARVAGVSTQQIRNYVDAAILPPTPRTPSGYRQFDARHRRALLTYRALAAGFGPTTAQAIMRALHADDLSLALSLIDAAHAALHEQRLSLRATGEALEVVAGQDTSTLPRSGLRVGELAAHLGVRASALRVWEAEGLLKPVREPGTGYRRYRPTDIRDARMIHMLRQGHYRLPQIRPILDGLRRTGGSEALRAAVAQRLAELTRRARAMLDGASHLHDYVTSTEDPEPRGEDAVRVEQPLPA